MKLSGNALAVLILGIIMTVAMWICTNVLFPTLIVLAVTLIATTVFARLQSRYDDARATLGERPAHGFDEGDGEAGPTPGDDVR